MCTNEFVYKQTLRSHYLWKKGFFTQTIHDNFLYQPQTTVTQNEQKNKTANEKREENNLTTTKEQIE